jgi:rhamnose utilization protein RhaD (predicted bifunctional aldolase and dehydrogenase)
MSKARRKTKNINLVIAEHHGVISKDDVARRAYELFLARGQAEGHDVEDWLEAERQLEAESMGLQLKEGVQAAFETVRTG